MSNPPSLLDIDNPSRVCNWVCTVTPFALFVLFYLFGKLDYAIHVPSPFSDEHGGQSCGEG